MPRSRVSQRLYAEDPSRREPDLWSLQTFVALRQIHGHARNRFIRGDMPRKSERRKRNRRCPETVGNVATRSHASSEVRVGALFTPSGQSPGNPNYTSSLGEPAHPINHAPSFPSRRGPMIVGQTEEGVSTPEASLARNPNSRP